MAQIVHTSIIVFGCLTALLAVLLAIPACRLREVIYRLAEPIHRNPRQLD